MPMRFSRGLSKRKKPRNANARTSHLSGGAMDAQTFGEQFRAASRVMWLIAVGIVGDASEAEDIVQDAAVVAYRKWNEFQPGSSFRAWVGAIVRNVALNTLRSNRRRRGAINGFAESTSASAASEELAGDENVIAMESGLDSRVLLALADIGDIARACLLLRTVGELHYSEIASLLDIPEGTAMSHVHRSRAQLRERLAGVWSEHGGFRSAESDGKA